MAGMRRRLRGLTTRVTGPAAALPPEPPPLPAAEPPADPAPDTAGAPVSETGGVSPVTELPEHASTEMSTESSAESEPRAERAALDEVCAAAIDLARAVAVEVGGSAVGDHQGVEADDERVVTHSFASTDPAYVGWRWAVTVARADGTDQVTVDEVVLLPGSGALVAPAWVPWSERVQPGDLSPGDLLPPPLDDPRIVPAYAETELELAAETFWELGLGRPRVLSADGRTDAAERWYDGTHGPATPMARQAPGQCLDCAFRLPLAGSLRALFGVCANAFAPDDGTVVSLDHGCGAHSEVPQQLTHVSGTALVVEHEELEVVSTAPSPDDETPDGHAS